MLARRSKLKQCPGNFAAKLIRAEAVVHHPGKSNSDTGLFHIVRIGCY